MPPLSRRGRWLAGFAVGGIALGCVVGARIADYEKSPKAAATRSWHGHVGKVARSGAETAGGLFARTEKGDTPLVGRGRRGGPPRDDQPRARADCV